MAKLTRAQAQKWNAQLSGGFTFDIMYYITWGEKVARRNIKLDNGETLQATLRYVDIREGYRYTGQVQPELHFQTWRNGNTEGVMVSSGMGASVKIGTPQNKKMWGELCRLSGTLDDEKLITMAKEHTQELKNPFII